jgi:oligopeptide transport system permease protein
MSAIAVPISPAELTPATSSWSRALRSPRVICGGAVLLVMLLLCVLSLPWTLDGGNRNENLPPSTLYYDHQRPDDARTPPGAEFWRWFGTDQLGRSLLGRCLLGGSLSLTIGLAAAFISVLLGVSVGLIAGYRGGRIDALLMRSVDILYGLPYVLLVILFKIAMEDPLTRAFSYLATKSSLIHASIEPRFTANIIVLFLGIGLVSWLTMARVVRGQVLSLRAQPFIEAARAAGLPEWRIFTRHLLPNLVGPIAVYATLIVPQAILQESFLSFLGVGIQAPLPTWGSLASEGLLPGLSPVNPNWWMLLFPCTLLAITLLSLNFLGDGLRDVFDPKREGAKI